MRNRRPRTTDSFNTRKQIGNHLVRSLQRTWSQYQNSCPRDDDGSLPTNPQRLQVRATVPAPSGRRELQNPPPRYDGAISW